MNARSTSDMARLRRITGVLPLSLLLLGACDPPGQPKLEPPPSDETLDFKVLYGENCAGCHGDNGKAGPGRPLNNPLYLAVMPKDALIQTVSYGRPGTAMPAWAKSQGGPLTDKQIHALADGIYQNWSKPQQFQHAKLPSYSGQGVTGNA